MKKLKHIHSFRVNYEEVYPKNLREIINNQKTEIK